jgi:hypothetical protein
MKESENLPHPDVHAQEIVVPRLTSLGTTPSQDYGLGHEPRRGVEDLEAAVEQFREIAENLDSENCNRIPREIELLDSPSPCDICALVSLPHH